MTYIILIANLLGYRKVMTRLASIRIWLFSIIGLIFCLVLLGGITRMKLAGLSIVEWKPVTGILPPLDLTEWELEFAKYRQIPQYERVFRDISRADFQFIYLLEYGHRLLARLIGLIVLAGVFFRRTRSIALKGGALILLQGAVGWWMVKSGLSDRVSVAPFRLAVHLCLAFLNIGYFYREALLLDLRTARRWTVTGGLLLVAVAAQFFLGALSSGTHAAEVFPTFPLMNGQWWPDGLGPFTLDRILSDHPLLSHWIHRALGAALLAAAWVQALRHGRTWQLLANLLTAQFAVGVLTVWTGGALGLKLLHQALPVFILLTLMRLIFRDAQRVQPRIVAAALMPLLLLTVAGSDAHAATPISGNNLLTGTEVQVRPGPRGTVAVFLSSTCPCSDSHVPELIELAREFPDFRFVGIHSNPSEGPASAKIYFQSKKLPFPVIQDGAQVLADQFRALKTPHAFVIAPSGTIEFQGGVSDRSDLANAERKTLREVLERLARGQKPESNTARTLGCAIRRKP